MSTNYTENFDLCQWEPTDPVIRTDFNADNAKIDAALAALESARADLEQASVTLAYYTGWLATTRMREEQTGIPQWAMIGETFLSSAGMTMTGGVTIQNNTLTLTGAGKTGTMSAPALAVFGTNWSQARLWVHYNGGTVTPTLNGSPMTFVRSFYGRSISGTMAWEREFVLHGTGGASGQVTLNLDTGDSDSMYVYDYYVVFL